jgi:hypothetical protein
MSMRPSSDRIRCIDPGREGFLAFVVDLTAGEPFDTDLADATLVEASLVDDCRAGGVLVDVDEVVNA